MIEIAYETTLNTEEKLLTKNQYKVHLFANSEYLTTQSDILE